MKTKTKAIAAIIAVSGVALSPAHAFLGIGDIVFDPAIESATFAQTAMEAANFVEMITHQVEQITTLTDQLNEVRHYIDLFGDPKSVVLASERALKDELTRPEIGKPLLDLAKSADAASAMAYDGGGLFHVVGSEFKTPDGNTVKRSEEPYRPVAAIQKTADNFQVVSKDINKRRLALKSEIARTTEALKSAKTDAEVQKLSGVLVGLGTALNGTDYELNQAATSVLVQDVSNRADERRQAEASKEQQSAEFTEALGNYAQSFRLLTEPARFPTK